MHTYGNRPMAARLVAIGTLLVVLMALIGCGQTSSPEAKPTEAGTTGATPSGQAAQPHGAGEDRDAKDTSEVHTSGGSSTPAPGGG